MGSDEAVKVQFTPPSRQADVNHGMKVPYAPGRRNVVPWRWYVILATVLSPFLYLVYTLILPLIVILAPGFVSLHKESVTSVLPGTVSSVLTHVGERIKEGHVLFEMIDPQVDEQLAVLRHTLTSEEDRSQEMPKTLDVPPENDLHLYQQQGKLAEKIWRQQQQRLTTIKQLFAQGAATWAEINAAQALADSAEHDLLQAQMQMQAASQRTGLPLPKKDQPKLDRQELERQRTELEARRLRQIRAKYAGVVLDIPVETGKSVSAGEILAVIGADSHPQVTAYVKPQYGARIQAGTRAVVEFPGGPSLPAKVHDQPTQARRLPADLSSMIGTRDIMLLVTLDFQGELPIPSERIVEGLPVEVRFHRF